MRQWELRGRKHTLEKGFENTQERNLFHTAIFYFVKSFYQFSQGPLEKENGGGGRRRRM